MRWLTGDVVVRREVLHGRVWSAIPMRVVKDSADLLALYLPEGAPMAFGAGEWPTESGKHGWDRGPGTTWAGHGVLQLHPPDLAYAVWVFWHGPEREFAGWYVNLQRPYSRTAIGIDTLDHELDIVVAPDGAWFYKDEDQLDDCVVRGRFTKAEVDAILALGVELGHELDAGERWWSEDWASWQPAAAWAEPPVLPPGWDQAP